MQITITGRKMEVTPPIRKYVEGKVGKVKRYLNAPITAHMILKVEKNRQIAEVSVQANGVTLNGLHESSDLYSSIDSVMDKIERQAKKFKEKLKTPKRKEHPLSTEMQEDE